MAQTIAEPKDLLRKKIDDAEVTAFLAVLDPKTKVIRNELKEPRWISKRAGVVVYSDKDKAVIHTVFLYAEGHEGYKQYPRALPHGLKFSMMKAQATSCFSSPADFTSDEHDTWDSDDYRIIVEYGDTGQIATVTLTTDF